MHTPTGYARDATCCYRVCVIKILDVLPAAMAKPMT